MELFKVVDYEYIKVINGRWTLNGKTFNEMTLSERFTVQEKIQSL